MGGSTNPPPASLKVKEKTEIILSLGAQYRYKRQQLIRKPSHMTIYKDNIMSNNRSPGNNNDNNNNLIVTMIIIIIALIKHYF